MSPGSDEEESTALDALAFSYVLGRGRGHAVVSKVSSSDGDMPYNWASGWGRSRDEQRRQSPRLQTYQAGPGAKDAPEPLGHLSVGSDLHREVSKSQNILLKWFSTSLIKNCFLADTHQMLP